jgi:hypothetical protein
MYCRMEMCFMCGVLFVLRMEASSPLGCTVDIYDVSIHFLQSPGILSYFLFNACCPFLCAVHERAHAGR